MRKVNIKVSKKNDVNRNIHMKAKHTNSIRVLYKKVGQVPEVKIISNVYKLKKAIIQKNLDIIPYEKLFIICHNKKTNSNLLPNIFLPFNRILGDFIVVRIDRKEREFKSLSQEDIIWYSQDLINKAPRNTVRVAKYPKSINVKDIYERGAEDNRYNKTLDFEKTLIGVLINIELLLATIIKNDGDDKNE